MKTFPFALGIVVAALVVVRWRKLSNESRALGIGLAAILVVYGTGVIHLPNFEHLIEDLGTKLGNWTYLLVGALAFLETGAFVGLIAPGEFTIIFGGVVAGQGKINVVLLIALVWACAVAGDSASYLLGRKLGRQFMVRHGPRFKITEERLEKVEAFFARHGGKTVLIGRFIGLVRAIAPFIAGASRMPYGRFLSYDVIGCGIWGTVLVLLGYIFWHSFDQVANWASKGAVALGTILTLGVGIVAAVRYLRVPENRERVKAWLDEQSRRPVVGPVFRAAFPLWRRVLRPCWRAVAVPVRFLWNRVTPGELGLELTTLLAVFLVGSFAYVGGLMVLTDQTYLPGDRAVLRLADRLHNHTLVEVAKGVAWLGSSPVVGGLTAITAVWLAIRRRTTELATLIVAWPLTLAAVHITKVAEDRPRPSHPLSDTIGSSYPSAHAAYVIGLVAIAVVVARVLEGLVSRFALVTTAIAIALAVGATRLYLRAHYLSDVVGGFGLGAAIYTLCAMAALIVSFLRHNSRRG